MSVLDHQLPQAAEAEAGLLGALIASEDAERDLARIDPIIRPLHFAKDSHREIFETIRGLALQRGKFSPVDVIDVLRSSARLEAVGGASYIAGLMDYWQPGSNLEAFAASIAEAHAKKELIQACASTARRVVSGMRSAEAAAELAATCGALGIADSRSSRGIFDVVTEVHRAADERVANGQSAGVLTGLDFLDAATAGGLPRKALTAQAGPSSHGKTTLAVNLADNAVNLRQTAVLYSLEMSPAAIADRLIARRSGVSLKAVRNWRFLTPAQRAEVDQARNDLRAINQRLFFADRLISVDDICADARQRAARGGLDLVVVDYLQLVETPEGDERTRERTVNRIAWKLAQLAKDLNIAVLALSQVTPAAQNRSGGRLSLDDLRDSKAIGHHARLVLMLRRPWQSDKASTEYRPCTAYLQVEKNSEGETGDTLLHFNVDLQEFTEGECVPGCRFYVWPPRGVVR